VNYWTHLHEGDQAYESMSVLFRQSTFPNLMDTHPPGVFQIDGNLGGANGMLETLVQSRWYPDHCEVELLPALPSVWKSGSVSGVRVRGGSELDLQWESGKARVARWRASQERTFRIYLPAGQKLAGVTVDGKKQRLAEESGGAVSLNVHKGTAYELSFQ
jgi:alpha-L-fucosidase 2